MPKTIPLTGSVMLPLQDNLWKVVTTFIYTFFSVICRAMCPPQVGNVRGNKQCIRDKEVKKTFDLLSQGSSSFMGSNCNPSPLLMDLTRDTYTDQCGTRPPMLKSSVFLNLGRLSTTYQS